MIMRYVTAYFSTLFAAATLVTAAPKKFGGTFTDAAAADLPADFKYQGEYANENLGAQVIALDKGAFQAVIYPGGLPGAGWDGKNKILLDGKLEGDSVILHAAKGKKRYLGNSPAEFSATRKFPPAGHKGYSGVISSGKLEGKTDKGKAFSLAKTNRKSPTMGKKPPSKAIVLFDGSNKNEWQGGRVDAKTKLLNTDGGDIRTKRKFNDYHMHIEFLLPYRPAARGQGRGNSGFYQVDHYEVQILDSFGLEGLNNECGGIYSKKASDINGCFPPLSWQTYDVEFTNARSKDGKKVKNAVLTARLNGILIHNAYEIPGKTGGSRGDPEGTPGPIKLQGHGNPLQFRNVWIIEK
ncbi:uncharacterized protein METZ01_LOCUS164999 [marine metagenome]|uniref:3-keto-alpha-glucoside-1,2-lyase/3-keto-2-hydroxy-glucal hydratase domain-containing protein n=1 Tax=marine metagenome TaxID=408172 RepID=A0A382BE97_9ZZZZ